MKWEYLEDATAISDIVFAYFENHSKAKGFAYEVLRIEYLKGKNEIHMVYIELVIAPKEFMLKTSYEFFSLAIPLHSYDGVDNTKIYTLLNRTYETYLIKREMRGGDDGL